MKIGLKKCDFSKNTPGQCCREGTHEILFQLEVREIVYQSFVEEEERKKEMYDAK